jgi:hypothetical protein
MDLLMLLFPPVCLLYPSIVCEAYVRRADPSKLGNQRPARALNAGKQAHMTDIWTSITDQWIKGYNPVVWLIPQRLFQNTTTRMMAMIVSLVRSSVIMIKLRTDNRGIHTMTQQQTSRLRQSSSSVVAAIWSPPTRASESRPSQQKYWLDSWSR